MKIRIILVNFLILVLILGSIEFYYVKKWNVTSFKQYLNILTNTISVDEYFSKLFKHEAIEQSFTPYFRGDINLSSTSAPILLCGCSFAWGEALKDNETVSYQLSKLTDRPVYNRAGRGWGLAQFLYLTGREEFYDIPEPEYLIYIYIEDHRNRIDRFKVTPSAINFQPKYKVSENQLIWENPHFYDKLFAVADFQREYNYRFWRVTDKTVELYFLQAEKRIRQHWKNTKLVIFAYPIGIVEEGNYKERKMWKDLKSKYTVIHAEDLTEVNLKSDKYRVDGWHPNAEAWQILLPKMVEILM